MAGTALAPLSSPILYLFIVIAAVSLMSPTGASVIDVTSSTSPQVHHSYPSSAVPPRGNPSTSTTLEINHAAVRNHDRRRGRKHRLAFTTSITTSSNRDVTQRPKNLARLLRLDDLTGSSPTAGAATAVVCPAGQFFSRTKLSCAPCSTKCPTNQIIRRPCSARRDMVCGPFSEFDKFRQTPPKDTDEVLKGVVGEYWKGGRGRKHRGPHHKEGRHHQHHHRKGHHNQEQQNTHASEAREETDLTSVSLDRARSQWRVLSIALIIVLSIVCCFVVGVGMYVYIVCRRSRTEQKHFFREPELLATRAYQDYDDIDAEPRYVQMYFTSDCERSLKAARHLPIYQQIYSGGDSSEFPSLTTSSTTLLTAKEPSSGRELEEEGEDQYIYFNLPTVCKSSGEV